MIQLVLNSILLLSVSMAYAGENTSAATEATYCTICIDGPTFVSPGISYELKDIVKMIRYQDLNEKNKSQKSGQSGEDATFTAIESVSDKLSRERAENMTALAGRPIDQMDVVRAVINPNINFYRNELSLQNLKTKFFSNGGSNLETDSNHSATTPGKVAKDSSDENYKLGYRVGNESAIELETKKYQVSDAQYKLELLRCYFDCNAGTHLKVTAQKQISKLSSFSSRAYYNFDDKAKLELRYELKF